MAKLILLSVVPAMVVIPLALAREPNPVRGLKKALVYSAVFNGAYLLAVLFLYPRLL